MNFFLSSGGFSDLFILSCNEGVSIVEGQIALHRIFFATKSFAIDFPEVDVVSNIVPVQPVNTGSSFET